MPTQRPFVAMTLLMTLMSGHTLAQSSAKGPTGTLQKTHDAWRASTLVGSSVYDDAGDSIGTIDDLLAGDDGKIQTVLVSVGGLLGVGSKLVAVPWDRLKFVRSTTSSAARAPTTPNGTETAGGNPTTGPAPAANSNGAGAANFSVVLTGASKESLTKMPEFK